MASSKVINHQRVVADYDNQDKFSLNDFPVALIFLQTIVILTSLWAKNGFTNMPLKSQRY